MTKEDVIESLDKSGFDYEIVAEHEDSFHIIVKASKDEEVSA